MKFCELIAKFETKLTTKLDFEETLEVLGCLEWIFGFFDRFQIDRKFDFQVFEKCFISNKKKCVEQDTGGKQQSNKFQSRTKKLKGMGES